MNPNKYKVKPWIDWKANIHSKSMNKTHVKKFSQNLVNTKWGHPKIAQKIDLLEFNEIKIPPPKWDQISKIPIKIELKFHMPVLTT